jgi:hypothetical protein
MICKNCKIDKKEEEFYKRSSGGKSVSCRGCYNSQQKKHKELHKEESNTKRKNWLDKSGKRKIYRERQNEKIRELTYNKESTYWKHKKPGTKYYLSTKGMSHCSWKPKAYNPGISFNKLLN